MHLVTCNGNLRGQTGRKLNVDLIRFDMQTRFPSGQLSGFFRQGLNQQFHFCNFWFNIHTFFYHPFFETFTGLFCPKFFSVYDASLYYNFFSTATGFTSSSERESKNCKHWMFLKWETWNFIALSGNWVCWKFRALPRMCFFCDLNSYVSKTNGWTSSTKVSVDNRF